MLLELDSGDSGVSEVGLMGGCLSQDGQVLPIGDDQLLHGRVFQIITSTNIRFSNFGKNKGKITATLESRFWPSLTIADYFWPPAQAIQVSEVTFQD